MTDDMSVAIVPKSDQINADDLIAGEMTILVTKVTINGGTEQPVSINFKGSNKFYRPCKSMARVLVAAWGPSSANYVGRSITLFRDPTVKWGGLEVGGVRISHMSHIDRDVMLMLTATKGSRKPYTVKRLRGGSQRDEEEPVRSYTEIDGKSRLTACDSLESLKAVWSETSMAEHRPALKPVLEEMKGRLAGGHSAAEVNLNHSKDQIDKCSSAEAVDKTTSKFLPALNDDDGEKLRAYAWVKIAELEAF